LVENPGFFCQGVEILRVFGGFSLIQNFLVSHDYIQTKTCVAALLLLLRLVELFSAGQLLSEALDSQEERVRAMVYL
jgi:hypothetical protein